MATDVVRESGEGVVHGMMPAEELTPPLPLREFKDETGRAYYAVRNFQDPT